MFVFEAFSNSLKGEALVKCNKGVEVYVHPKKFCYFRFQVNDWQSPKTIKLYYVLFLLKLPCTMHQARGLSTLHPRDLLI